MDALLGEPAGLVIDLRHVGFFGSAGLRSLVIAHRIASRYSVDLRLLCTG